MSTAMEHFPLLSLPEPALQAVVDALRCQSTGAGGALRGLRGTCRQLKAEANARTRRVSAALCGSGAEMREDEQGGHNAAPISNRNANQ